MTRSAIFDLDATLVDSQKVAAQSFIDAFHACNLQGEPSVASFLALSGIPLEEVCTQLALPLEAFPAQFRAASRRRQHELTLFPGVGSILKLLYDHDVTLGIITSKDRARTLETLALLDIDQYFSCVVTPDDPPAPKPSPEGVLWICQMFDTASSETLVVGDSVLDIRAGRDAGAITVGCTWGVADREALAHVGADFVVESVDELTDLLRATYGML